MFPIPSAGMISNTVTTIPCTNRAFVGFPSSFVLTSHFPNTPSGISEKNTLTGAAVQSASEPRLPSNRITPTRRTITPLGIPKCPPRIWNTSKIPFEKLPERTSPGTISPTATAPRTYMIPTNTVDITITLTNVLFPPLTSFT